MELGEWVLRTIFALVLVNLFIGGLYLILRGYFTHYTLTRFWVLRRATLNRSKKFRANVNWVYKGEDVYAVVPHLFTFQKKQDVNIFMSPHGYQFKFNTWSYNGKAMILGGSILLVSSLTMFILWI